MSTRIVVVSWAVLTATLVMISGSGAAARVPGNCTHWAGPGGDDAGAGSEAQPYATTAKLLASLRPGQRGCYTPGAVVDEHVVVNAAGSKAAKIYLSSTPNARGAILRGGIEFEQSSHDVVLERLAIRAPATQTTPGIVMLRGYRNAIVESDINGQETPDRNQSCIVLDHANLAIVDHDAIRACTRVAADPTIYSAGVLDAVSVHAQISNNLISRQTADGVALSPDAQYTLVSRNLIQNNGSGVFFGGDTKSAANDNQVVGNAIGPSSAFSIHSSYNPGAPVGKRNVVSHNCLWRAPKGIGYATARKPGFVARDNVAANPASARCKQYRPSAAAVTSVAQKPKPKPKPKPSAGKPLGAGLRLLAGAAITGTRVTLVQPSVSGVASGAVVTIRCVRGCKLSERLTAKSTRVSSHVFAHAVLNIGDEVEVRASKAGFIGRYARFAVAPSVTAGAFKLAQQGCLNGNKHVSCPKP